MPTRVDFDNDFELANNLESAREPGPSFAYFDVTESRTHHFLTYLYYYPGSVPRTGIEFEHDWVIAQLVVEKTEDDPLGRLRAFSTVYHENFNAWRMDPSFYPDGMVVERGDGELIGDLNVSDLVDGRRPTLFIEGGCHGFACRARGCCRSVPPTTGTRLPAEDALALTPARRAGGALGWRGRRSSPTTCSRSPRPSGRCATAAARRTASLR